jgi:hypothetical protein
MWISRVGTFSYPPSSRGSCEHWLTDNSPNITAVLASRAITDASFYYFLKETLESEAPVNLRSYSILKMNEQKLNSII